MTMPSSSIPRWSWPPSSRPRWRWRWPSPSLLRRVEVVIPIFFQGGGGHPISSNVGVDIPISSKEGGVTMLY